MGRRFLFKVVVKDTIHTGFVGTLYREEFYRFWCVTGRQEKTGLRLFLVL